MVVDCTKETTRRSSDGPEVPQEGGGQWGGCGPRRAGGRGVPSHVDRTGGLAGSDGAGGQPEVARGEPGPFEELPHDLCAETRKGVRRETGGLGC